MDMDYLQGRTKNEIWLISMGRRQYFLSQLIVLQLTCTNPSRIFFPVWAGFSERTREGNKFIVADKPALSGRKFCAETAESIAEERKLKKESAANGFFSESGNNENPANLLDSLFDS